VWSPDGRLLAFVSARHDGHELDRRSALHVVSTDDVEGDGDGVPEAGAVSGGDLAVGGARWLPDGRLALLAVDLGPTGLDFVARPTRLWVTDGPVSGPGVVPTTALTDERLLALDGGTADLVVADGHLLVRDLARGCVRLLRVDPGAPGAEPEVVLDGPITVTGHAATDDGSTVVVSAATAERVGDLGVLGEGGVTWLTDVSGRLRDEAGVVAPIDVVAISGDGHPVHGWVILPDAERYGAGPHPVLLNIHGGPFAQYPATIFDEAQVYAGAGYAVAMCNPRGSAGYGFEHGRAIRHAVGSVDADDVVAFLDHVLANDELPVDPDRVGVMGGSYGGYMTALLTTRTDRFAAAIVERGYLDAASFVGSSDIGWFFPGEYHGSHAAMVEQSPMNAVDRVTTPTLVIHSEHDWRCPVEQGQRWFVNLRMRGVPTELLLFPGEGHELSRSGRPRHRRERFEHILRWWGTYLPVADAEVSDRLH
jgi:dipeptidyl aminopeptidase/acylaminoacyl peptidase